MKKTYLVGGPKISQFEEFCQCARLMGKRPTAWSINSRTSKGGEDSGLTPSMSQAVVWNLLLRYDGASEWGQIVAIPERVH